MKLVVFASGGGSNFDAICKAIDEGRLAAEVVGLVSDRPTAGAIRIAADRSIPTSVIDPRDFGSVDTFAEALSTFADERGADFAALAGFLRKIPDAFVAKFAGRLLNIHPSLLPAFGGKGMYGGRVHQAVLDYGAKWTGATVHLVDNSYDTGPVVMQEVVPVHPGDTAETLAARVLRTEHRIYAQALQAFALDRVRIDGRSVTIDMLSEPSTGEAARDAEVNGRSIEKTQQNHD